MTDAIEQEVLRTERLDACPLRNCPQHPEEEMNFRCIRSGRLLCMNCAQPTPTGYIAKEIARKHDDRFFKGTIRDYMLTTIICGVGMALLCGVMVYGDIDSLLDMRLLVFTAPVVGGGLAEAVLRLTERRRGRYSDIVSATAIMLAGIGAAFVMMLIKTSSLELATSYVTQNVMLIFFITLTAMTAYARFQFRFEF